VAKVTIYDLARELGLSSSTVSRALDDSELVGDSTRLLVRSAAQRLGYQRRTVRRPESRSILTIKLYLPPSRDAYVHLFYDVAELLDGLQRGFGEVRINVLVCLNDGLDDSFASKKTGTVDGAVFAFTEADAALYARYESRGVPVVHINRVQGNRPSVAVDNAVGMETLLRRVALQRPGVKPCFLGFTPVAYTSRQRQTGVLAAASVLGIAMTTEDCFELESIASLDGALVRSLVARGYNAVLCFNDLMAVHVFNRAWREGFEIPRDFALTGFDNAPVLDVAAKRIDTIEFATGELGWHAGCWLRERLIERQTRSLNLILAGEYVPGETL